MTDTPPESPEKPALEAEQEGPLPKLYEHGQVESRWYQFWMSRGYFRAQDQSEKPPFSIVMPPPNITGSLHVGHALTATLQDVLIRWRRMSGDNALWLPGTDHASIATHVVIERELFKTEGKTRLDLGREEFLKRAWAWRAKYGARISEQHQALGASLDWERERFTMDDVSSRAVREAFVRLHQDGLIYREKKLINWCPSCRSAVSDLEVSYDEKHQGELWRFAYPLSDGSGEIVVATTRPETILGDVAVAVHPEDPRYQQLIGKTARHPLVNRDVQIIGDSILVDPAFGTGAVKVTPAHDFNDYEVGKRHNLPMISVIDFDGRMSAEAGPLAGLDRFLARTRVKELLGELGLERGAEPHAFPLGKCQRSDTVLEPLLSNQWFVRAKVLAEPAIEAVRSGQVKFFPESWTATYMSWMTNIHDWCISRQLWWGHQIPAWYCPEQHITVAAEPPRNCGTCGKTDLTQEGDILDTWFSSGLWPFSTLGWPEQTAALKTFYPNSVMETGHDIIFFWVARMMMLGIKLMGEVPFKTVFLHAMVRDEKGQKMSKTKGNVIDPLDVTKEFGADALRFTLTALTAQGRDIKMNKERIAGYRAFANKIWNAARFALINLEGFQADAYENRVTALQLSASDRWILARLQRTTNEAIAALAAFRFNDVAAILYQFTWHELCDWYIELSKEALGATERSSPARRAAQATLTHCLDHTLRLLHPVMPFLTEELWQTTRNHVAAQSWGEALMVAPFPQVGPVEEAAEQSFGRVIALIDSIRNIRGEMNVPPKAMITTQVASSDHQLLTVLRAEEQRIARLAKVKLQWVEGNSTLPEPASAVAVGPGFEVRVTLLGIVDVQAEATRLEKEIGKIEADLTGIQKKLDNPNFVAKAPADVIEKDRARAAELEAKRDRLRGHHRALIRR